jgi:hypothetical protein
MKIGIVQTQRLGDLIIVLPIAQWFVGQGHQVFWPIHAAHIAAMAAAAPAIAFLPVDPALEKADPVAFFLHKPLELLNEIGCDHIHSFYTHLEGDGLIDGKLLGSLKFDEYKYARARVPFVEKWNLRLVRNRERELALYQSLNITGDYVLVHRDGSILSIDVQLPPSWAERYRIIDITPLTDNPFDWLYVIENASKLVMIDSSFANLTDQLNIAGEKYLILRSLIQQTPVYRNGWIFCWPFDPIPDLQT